MFYLQDRKKDKMKKNLILAIGIVFVLLVLSLVGVFNFTAPFFHKLGLPLWNEKNKISQTVDSSGYIVRTKASVFAENENLKTQNHNLQNQLLDYQVIQNENNDLKSLMGRAITPDQFTLGTILIKPNQSPYDTVIIDIGSDHSLYVGQLVFANAEVPIGKILGVDTHTSVVELYSSPGEITEAQVDGTNSSVELTGRGGGNFEMTVPHDLSVPSGTSIVLPGINPRIVAIVGDTISDPRDPTSKVILSSPVNIQNLKWVEVLK